MRGFLVQAVFAAVGLWLASRLLDGVQVTSTLSLIAAAVLLGVVNALVRPVLVLLTLPITLLTLGLFLLVVNGLMIGLVALFLRGFEIDGLFSAVLAALIISIVSWIGWRLVGRG
ncbi:MAG TPA: phage holin family protein [Caulobacteraceae bacterium]|jgi:putative membrane protein